MFDSLLVDYELHHLRERNARLRREAEYSRMFRASKQRHRFRSRHRGPEPPKGKR